MNKIAILGAGNGGFAASCDLANKGYSVNLFEGFAPDLLKPLQEKCGIEFVGAIGEGFAKLNVITSDIEEAVEGVRLIMVVVPSSGHEYHAKKVAPYLQGNELIILTPGHTGGSLHFANVLRNEGVKVKVNICETNTLPYVTRKETLSRVRIFSKDKNILFSVFPSKNLGEVYEIVRPLYPDLLLAENVLETGLMNDNALVHPPAMILNAGWIEHSGGDFAFYRDGFTPSVANVVEALESERLATVRAFGLKSVRFVDWWAKTGRTSRTDSFYEAIRASESNKALRAPDSMKHRFLEEDIEYGLVPMSCFARIADIKTPTMTSLIYLASMINKVDYAKQGLGTHRMGIRNLNLKGVKAFVKEGYQPRTE